MKNQIIKDYLNGMPKHKVCEKYSLQKHELNKILTDNKIKSRSIKETLKLKRAKIFESFINDKQLTTKFVNEYSNGANYKCLIHKYKLKLVANEIFDYLKINRRTSGETFKILNDKKNEKKNNELITLLIQTGIYQKIIEMYKNLTNYKSIAVFFDIPKFVVKNILVKEKVFRSSKDTLQQQFRDRVAFGNPQVKLYFYNNNLYQGTYELRFAIWLEKQNLKFQTHKDIKIFNYITKDNKKRCYNPDFYVYDWNEYIDVKGLFYDKDVEKIKLVKEQNAEYKFRVIQSEELEKMGVLDVFGVKRKYVAQILNVFEFKNQEKENIFKLLKTYKEKAIETGKLV